MIAIGNQFGGPEQRGGPAYLALNKAMNVAIESRDSSYDDGKEAWVNPIFILPGSIAKPDFEGYEVGKFSRSKKGLVIMVAVPQSVADGEGIVDFIICSLRDVAQIAADYFGKRGIDFDLLKTESILRNIDSSLRQ